MLPVTIDEVVYWKAPSLLIETAMTEGVMLTSPTDMVKLWPSLWSNEKAAYRTFKEGVPDLPGFERVEYQLAGPKMNRREALFDRSLIPDPLAWLETRLGALCPGNVRTDSLNILFLRDLSGRSPKIALQPLDRRPVAGYTEEGRRKGHG